MEIHQLEYLIAIAEEGSFTRAAERLLVAQPSLSQQIKKLEQEVGRPLFDRLPRGVVLTEAGYRLLEHARRVLSEMNDGKRRVAEVGDQVAGALTVGAIPTIAPFLLPAAVSAFLRRWPGVAFTVIEDVTAKLLDGLERGELDLAIMSSAEHLPTIHLETVATEPLLLVVAKGHRLARRREVVWPDVEEERFLVLQDMHCLTGQVLQFCGAHGARPRIAARGAQLSTIAAMVSAGLGVSMVPKMFRDADSASDRAYLPFAQPGPTRDLCLAWSLRRYRTNAARALAETVRSLLSSAPGR
jgi:LysR family hydrogen peroxide-inducible transcriptional activator